MKKLVFLLVCACMVQTAFSQDSAKATYYAKMAKQQYRSENFDSSVVLYRMALNMDSILSWIQFDNALACIIRGKGDPVENYTRALIVNEHAANGKKALSNAMNDLDEAQRQYGPLIEYDAVKQVLIDRYNRYP
jgi:hypothetical protein